MVQQSRECEAQASSWACRTKLTLGQWRPSQASNIKSLKSLIEGDVEEVPEQVTVALSPRGHQGAESAPPGPRG